MTNRRSQSVDPEKTSSPQELLLAYIDQGLDIAKKAKRHNKSLNGTSFYAQKMDGLRAEATNAFGRLSAKSVGDVSALAELMQIVFSRTAAAKQRTEAARDLRFAIKTTWKDAPSDNSSLEQGGVFPLVTLTATGRGYLVAVGRQANGCYASGWYDGCAVMMRRLLESSIIEAFEARKIEAKITDTRTGDFLPLTALIKAALAEATWNLPRNVRKELTNLRDLGHKSAHSRYYVAKQPDIDKHIGVYREAVEAFLHLAGLLK